MEGQVICIIWLIGLVALNYIIYFAYTRNKNFDYTIENKN